MVIIASSSRNGIDVSIEMDGNGDYWVFCRRNGVIVAQKKLSGEERSTIDNARDTLSPEDFDTLINSYCS